MNKRSQRTMYLIKRDPVQFLKQKWRTMKARVDNKLGDHPTYDGLPICGQDEFVEWALHDRPFNLFYEEYRASEFDKMKTPSIDRIENSMGYVLGNMQFTTITENSQKANRKAWLIQIPNGDIIRIVNMAKFCRDNGLSRGNLHETLKNYKRRKQHKGYRVISYADD